MNIYPLHLYNFEIKHMNEEISHSKCHFRILAAALAFPICASQKIKSRKYFLATERDVQITEFVSN